MKMFKCNGETLYVSNNDGETWRFVTDCCGSLWEISESIIHAIDPLIDIIDEDEEDY